MNVYIINVWGYTEILPNSALRDKIKTERWKVKVVKMLSISGYYGNYCWFAFVLWCGYFSVSFHPLYDVIQ